MRFKRSYIAAIHDIIMAALSFIISMSLRLGDDSQIFSMPVLINSIIFAGVAIVVFGSFKLYKGIWRYASVQDLIAITKAVTITILVFSFILFLINRLENVPRSLFIINWLVLLVMLGGPRFAYRAVKDRSLGLWFAIRQDKKSDNKKIPVIVVGINNNCELFLRETLRNTSSTYEVVGIIDEDKTKIGSNIYKVKILGSYNSLPQIFNKLKKKGKTPQKLILTADYIDGQFVRNLLAVADSLGMSLARLPKLTEFKATDVGKLEIQPIVIQDLLGRAQNTIDRNEIAKTIIGRRILVTGAGGTIGSELTRQIAAYNPKQMTLVDSSEYNLYSIDHELNATSSAIPRQAIIADIRNEALLDKIFVTYKPEIVFHAAALKHVPIAEANVCEAVLINAVGSMNVAESCLRHGVEKMIFISTDKAVNPVNVMGATKKAAESYIQALGQHQTDAHATSFISVRFGNVLGSSGSVIPLFEKQIKGGGPITITHPDMTRYFMTVREAVELVLQASALNKLSDKHSAIFVLDMGEPVKIRDLAVQMIRMTGLRPEIDIKIEYTGIRPGEKLYEELFYELEQPNKTSFESIMLAVPGVVDFKVLARLFAKMKEMALQYDEAGTLKILKELVPEYISGE